MFCMTHYPKHIPEVAFGEIMLVLLRRSVHYQAVHLTLPLQFYSNCSLVDVFPSGRKGSRADSLDRCTIPSAKARMRRRPPDGTPQISIAMQGLRGGAHRRSSLLGNPDADFHGRHVEVPDLQ